MSKAEMLRQSAAAANAKQLEQAAEKVESVRQAEHRSAEELAETLEPLAQAMAKLVQETRETLAAIDRKSAEQAASFTQQITHAVKSWNDASGAAEQSAGKLGRASAQLSWRHYLLCGAVGAVSAALVSGCWIWLAPVRPVENTLDPKAVAEYLKPAVIAALKPSKGK